MTDEEISRSMRAFQLTGFIGLIVVAGGIGVWAALASIQGAVIASGVVIVEGYSKKIQHREGGIVTTIAIKDGDQVTAGDLLVVLDETEIRSQLAILDSLIVENEAKAARLEALRDGSHNISFPQEVLERKAEPEVANIITAQQNLFKTLIDARAGRTGQLKERIDQIEKEIAGRKAQLVSRKSQFELITRELEGLEKLHKKELVPITRILALQRERADLSGQQGQLGAEIAVSRGRISETRLQIGQLEDDDRSKTLSDLRDIESKLSEWKERRVAVRATLGRTQIRAPRSGFIHQLAVHTIGGVIAPGEVIMLIVPALDNLVVEANINPQDIDQMALGQQARLRFSAFSQRTTPEINGAVSYISADYKQLNEKTPPFYTIKLSMTDTGIKKLGANKIIPGMPVEVFIQTAARTPFNYLVKPLKDQIMRTFREN